MEPAATCCHNLAGHRESGPNGLPSFSSPPTSSRDIPVHQSINRTGRPSFDSGGSRRIETPAMKRTANELTLDAAPAPEMGPEVRAIGVEHEGNSRLCPSQDHVAIEVAHRHERAGRDLIGVGDLVPAAWNREWEARGVRGLSIRPAVSSKHQGTSATERHSRLPRRGNQIGPHSRPASDTRRAP